MKNISLLGSTGSIGTQTLDIVDAYNDELNIVALAAGRNVVILESQIRKNNPEVAVLYDEKAARVGRIPIIPTIAPTTMSALGSVAASRSPSIPESTRVSVSFTRSLRSAAAFSS